jgi:LemA protein
MRTRLLAILALAATLLSGCGYNQIQINDESVGAAWSEVLNQYKRRADLIPNLVSVVQGYASHEKEVLTRVTEARANVAGLKATPELINDPAAFARFQKAQSELGGALSRLLVVAENYPNLKADANFRDLQAQVEGTENRITVARNRYIQGGEGIQHLGAHLPQQPDRDGHGLAGQGQFHGRGRKGDLGAAGDQVRRTGAESAAHAVTPAPTSAPAPAK